MDAKQPDLDVVISLEDFFLSPTIRSSGTARSQLISCLNQMLEKEDGRAHIAGVMWYSKNHVVSGASQIFLDAL